MRLETYKLNDANATESIEKVRNGDVDVDKLAEAWDRVYKQVCISLGTVRCSSVVHIHVL